MGDDVLPFVILGEVLLVCPSFESAWIRQVDLPFANLFLSCHPYIIDGTGSVALQRLKLHDDCLLVLNHCVRN
jgi:hypothetical protein